MSGEGYQIILQFDRDDLEFIQGFECGDFWYQLQEKPEELIEGYLHAGNVEMAIRMGEATRRKVDSLELPEDWLWVRFHPTGSLDTESLVSDEPFPEFTANDDL